MFNYQSTPDYYNEYIAHAGIYDLIGTGLRLKRNIDKQNSKIKIENLIPQEKRVSKVKGRINKVHKYVYKYLNKKGKVIYVYNTKTGKTKLRRMS